MPELPEVETVRLGLAPVMEGRRLARVDQNRPDLRWPLPQRFAERLTGRTVLRLRRRSKYLLIDMDGAETLIAHLGMSGRMLVEDGVVGDFVHAAGRLPQHDHVVFHVEDGPRIAFNDARRFGALDLWPTDALDEHRLLAGLGPEPLGNGFGAAWLAERFAGRRAPVKAMLLDQRIVAGLGNIYVCEALHAAGIAPARAAGSLSAQRIADLAQAVRDTLTAAIAAGGSSLKDFRHADGALGYFQHGFQTYGRAGQPCLKPGCGGAVARLTQSGRTSFWCPGCQL
ncbi:MAG: bifunctional DNA-formamidopyrimidine glycosylase/DNA-(apurinic or apyrimidinic site) lyase [Rubrimonas sp.]